MRRVKSEENKGVIAKHCLTLWYVNMAEESAECKLQDAAMFWDFGSVHMIVTGGRTVSTQKAGDHFKRSSRAEATATEAAVQQHTTLAQDGFGGGSHGVPPVEERTVQQSQILEAKR